MQIDPVRRGVQLAAVLGLVGTFACAGDNASRGGTLIVASAGDADYLLPPVTSLSQSRQVNDLLFEHLAAIGPELNTLGDAGWTPRLAERWTWNADSSAVTFHLNPKARWHDSVPVRAIDVQFAFSVYTDPRVAASDGRDIADVVDSMTVGDSLTATAWFRIRSPERFYTLVTSLVPLPEHLLRGARRDSLQQEAFTTHPVGSGPFRLTRWEPKQRMEVTAVNDYFLGRPHLDRIIWTISPEGKTAVQRVFTGEADFIETLTPGEVASAATHPDVNVTRLRGNVLGYLVFNMTDGLKSTPNPLFGDRAIRRALVMSLDRIAIARNVVDTAGRAPLGPFSRVQWSADSTLHQIPFDRAAAGRTLDSLGWRMGADSIRHRNGKPLAFSIIAPSSSGFRGPLAVVLQEQWRQIGAQVTVERMEFAEMGARLHSRQFDILLVQISTSPSPSGIRQAWTTAALSMKNGNNYGRYSNPVVDSAIDHAITATTLDVARAHYRVAYQTLLDDAGGIWLYEPAVMAGANKRLVLDGLRTDAWWTSIPTWRVQ